MKTAAVMALLLLTASTARAQSGSVVDESSRAALIPLFVSCDLKAEFTTPGLDERELRWLETPVSREGARYHEQSRERVIVTPVPLVVDAHSLAKQHSPAAPFDERVQGDGHIQLLASEDHNFNAPAKAIAPERTESSTWVRIRALYGH